MWSQAWIHARSAMVTLAPPEIPEEKGHWVEARLNELDVEETKVYLESGFGVNIT